MKGRFAPSPTGRMHLGNVMSALLSFLSARSQGGEWLLRIEDLDPQRCSQDNARRLEEDLVTLGLEWDEGGVDEGCCQSLRSDIYREAIKSLDVYPCYCSRSDLLSSSAPHESDGRIIYNGTCRNLLPLQRPDGPFSLRVRVPDREICFVDGHYGEQCFNLARDCGDFIVRRRDGVAAYQLAVTVDDLLMGVTEVVRGRDLLLSTPQQLFLRDCLSAGESPRPIRYCHIPLLCAPDGRRLSKRDAALDMGQLLQRFSPREIIGRVAFLCGIIPAPELCSPSELIPLFDISKVPLEDIPVDFAFLRAEK